MKCLWKNIEWHLPDIPEKQLKWTLFHENFKITNKMFMNFFVTLQLQQLQSWSTLIKVLTWKNPIYQLFKNHQIMKQFIIMYQFLYVYHLTINY